MNEREKTHIGKRADEIRVQRQKRINTVKAIVFAIGVGAVTIAGYEGIQQLQGRDNIRQEFMDKTRDFYYDDWSSGFQITRNGDPYEDFDDGLRAWVDEARSKGMSDKEIYIGFTTTPFSKKSIKEAIGKDFKISLTERWNVCETRYHDMKGSMGRAR